MTAPRIEIFISSPGDVAEERAIARGAVDRLRREFASEVILEAYLWEDKPLVATESPQIQIREPSEFDVVIFILWSRLGTPLESAGTRYASGTEFEFENALRARRCSEADGAALHRPDILVYHKRLETRVLLQNTKELRERLEQLEALNAFLSTHFDDHGSPTGVLHEFSSTAEFEEKLERHLRNLIRDWLPEQGAGDAGRAPASWFGESPYRRLEHFDLRHAPIFFGRTRAVGQVIEILRSQGARGCAFALILGPSGGGKSSLVRAGVLPRLMEPEVIEGIRSWRHAILRPAPADEAFVALAQSLMSDDCVPELLEKHSIEELASLLSSDLAVAIERIKAALSDAAALAMNQGGLQRPPEIRIALVVDQLEAIFEHDYVASQQHRHFISAIDAIARCGSFFVIATLQSQYYARCAELPLLTELKAQGQYDLPTPTPAEIGQIIQLPARAAGLSFEVRGADEESLADVLRDEAVAHPESLPLLEFTLDALYSGRSELAALTFDAYEKLGGVGGAIGMHAEEVYRGLPEANTRDYETALSTVFWTLVGFGADTKAPIPRVVRKDRVFTTPESAALVDAFEHARLLVSDRDSEGNRVFSVVHEALFRYWPRLNTWIQVNQELLRVRDRVVLAASAWRSQGKPATQLLIGKGLEEALDLIREAPEKLNHPEREYVVASGRRARRNKLRRYAVILSFVSLVFSVAAAVTWAIHRGDVVEKERAKRHIEHGSFEWISGHPGRALAYLSAAYLSTAYNKVKDDGPLPLRFLISRAISATVPLHRLSGHADSVTSAVFSPDGRRIATASADNTARIWDTTSGAELNALIGHDDKVFAIGFGPFGQRLVTGSLDGTARFWDVASGKQRLPFLDQPGDPVLGVEFSSDGTLVLAATDGEVRVWDTVNWRPLPRISGHTAKIVSAHFSPDGQRIITASRDETVRIWGTRLGTELEVLEPHSFGASGAEYSPDGTLIVTAESGPKRSTRDGSRQSGARIRVWDARSVKLLQEWTAHEKQILTVTFSPDSSRLITASEDGTVRVWNAATGTKIREIQDAEDGQWSASFSPDGLRILTMNHTRTTRVWDSSSGALLDSIQGDSKVLSAVFDPRGRSIVTGGVKGNALVWKISDGLVSALNGHTRGVAAISFGPDDVFVSAARDGSAYLWDANTWALSRTLRHHEELVAASFSPDGRHLVAVSENGTAMLWDAATHDLVIELNARARGFRTVAWASDGRLLATANRDNTASIWDLGGQSSLLNLHKGEVRAIAFHPNRPILATASMDGDAILWDAETGGWIRTLEGHTGGVVAAVFSPDGDMLLTASVDTTARVWDVETGEQISIHPHHTAALNSAIFNRTGSLALTTSNDGTANIWDSRTGLLRTALVGHRGPVLSGRFSPDAEEALVITGSADRTAAIWDARTGLRLSSLVGHSGAISEATFNATGDQVVTAGEGRSVIVWGIDLESPSPKDVDKLVGCYIPWKVDGGELVEARPDPSPCG